MALSTHSTLSKSALVILLAALIGMPVWISGPAEAKDAAELRAREQFLKGQKAYAAGEFQAALALFSEAYGLQPLPGFLFDIAQCHRQLGNYERAAVFYQQYLDLSPSKENIARVRALLAETRTAEKERKRRLVDQETLGTGGSAEESKIAARRWDLESAIAHAEPQGTVLGASLSSGSIFHKWWFWTGIGVVTAGTTAILLTSQHSNDGNGAGNSR